MQTQQDRQKAKMIALGLFMNGQGLREQRPAASGMGRKRNPKLKAQQEYVKTYGHMVRLSALF
jgi:hypothetical protein